MRRRLVLSLALALVAVAVCRTQGAAPEYRVGGMRALLFYADRGTFSEDVLADTTTALWNTVIGEGDAGGPSESTLVVVEVTGEPESYEPDRSVELRATAGGKVLLRHAAPVSGLSTQGKAYVGFWLYGTGCEPVRLTARLTGQASPAELRKEIPFECGE